MRNQPETVHEYNIPRLNVWFLVSGALFLLCLVLMIWVDYSGGRISWLALRGDREWKNYQAEFFTVEKARLEGAKHIPIGDIPSRAHQELDPEEHVIVICHHGVRSLTVTNWLRQQGFEKVQSMRGGIDGWARTVDPKVPLY